MIAYSIFILKFDCRLSETGYYRRTFSLLTFGLVVVIYEREKCRAALLIIFIVACQKLTCLLQRRDVYE